MSYFIFLLRCANKEMVENFTLWAILYPLRLTTLDASPFCFAKRGGTRSLQAYLWLSFSG